MKPWKARVKMVRQDGTVFGERLINLTASTHDHAKRVLDIYLKTHILGGQDLTYELRYLSQVVHQGVSSDKQIIIDSKDVSGPESK